MSDEFVASLIFHIFQTAECMHPGLQIRTCHVDARIPAPNESQASFPSIRATNRRQVHRPNLSIPRGMSKSV